MWGGVTQEFQRIKDCEIDYCWRYLSNEFLFSLFIFCSFFHQNWRTGQDRTGELEEYFKHWDQINHLSIFRDREDSKALTENPKINYWKMKHSSAFHLQSCWPTHPSDPHKYGIKCFFFKYCCSGTKKNQEGIFCCDFSFGIIHMQSQPDSSLNKKHSEYFGI